MKYCIYKIKNKWVQSNSFLYIQISIVINWIDSRTLRNTESYMSWIHTFYRSCSGWGWRGWSWSCYNRGTWRGYVAGRDRVSCSSDRPPTASPDRQNCLPCWRAHTTWCLGWWSCSSSRSWATTTVSYVSIWRIAYNWNGISSISGWPNGLTRMLVT